MAATLALKRASAWRTPSAEVAGSRVGTIRHALRSGPMTAHALAAVAGVSAKLVVPLLKADLASGRVCRHRPAGRALMLYELSEDYDAALQARFIEAKRLLTANGYLVTKKRQR